MKCPQCGKEIENPDLECRPFCSDRCKLIDLGKWISGEYRIASAEQIESDGEPVKPDTSPEEE